MRNCRLKVARGILMRAIFVLSAIFMLSACLGWNSRPASAQPTPSPATQALEALAANPAFGETRAFLVWQRGQWRAETYGPGFTADHRFVSWSMAKTVTAIALAMLIDDGKLTLDQPAPVRAWRTASDGRETLTLRHLLNMTTGLKHQEGGEGPDPIERADTVRLLFSDGAQDAAAYAISRPLAARPGAQWQYSTATTHILAEVVSQAITSTPDPSERRRILSAWFNARLWQPLGITSAEWDFDAKGLFLGGSMLHMTARDYARLGQFMLARGTTPSGARLLTERAFALLLEKADAPNNNHYAGHLWLNSGPAPGQPPVLFHPHGGQATFALVGHLGQYVIVVPHREMVIVRLGKSTRAERSNLMAAIGRFIDQDPQDQSR